VNITNQNIVNKGYSMAWKTRSLENILDLSEKENWSMQKKERYLQKIKHRIKILSFILSTRDNFRDILTSYIKNKIDDLAHISSVLEKKWKKV